VLAVGRRVPQKGLDVLLEAMPAGARLRLAGEGDRVSGAGIEDLGFRADVLELMALADVVVVPSRWEGFGLVALEAMAVGAPVIASAVDGLRDLVGDAGLLVPAGDVVASREAISRVLGDAGLRAELSARGRARAHAYDITAMVRAWEAVQRAAVRSRPASP
jgi:glycosyltransferase involved in cell wall biosynthesis